MRNLVRFFAPATIVIFVALHAASIAPAAENSSPRPRSGDLKPSQADVNTWVIFGFTEGSDVGSAGERTLFQDASLRTSQRKDGFAAIDGSWGAAYSPTDRFVVWLGGIASSEIRSQPRAETDVGSYYAAGVTAGAKYQLLSRQESPFGLSVQFSPSWQPLGIGAGEILTGELRGIVDGALVLDGWYTALNVAIQPQRTTSDQGARSYTTTVEISGAITYQLKDNVFLGGELRALKKTETARPWGEGARQLFAGPSLLVQLGTSGYFGISWSIQIASDASSAEARELALDRHQVRIKSGFSF